MKMQQSLYSFYTLASQRRIKIFPKQCMHMVWFEYVTCNLKPDKTEQTTQLLKHF